MFNGGGNNGDNAVGFSNANVKSGNGELADSMIYNIAGNIFSSIKNSSFSAFQTAISAAYENGTFGNTGIGKLNNIMNTFVDTIFPNSTKNFEIQLPPHARVIQANTPDATALVESKHIDDIDFSKIEVKLLDDNVRYYGAEMRAKIDWSRSNMAKKGPLKRKSTEVFTVVGCKFLLDYSPESEAYARMYKKHINALVAEKPMMFRCMGHIQNTITRAGLPVGIYPNDNAGALGFYKSKTEFNLYDDTDELMVMHPNSKSPFQGGWGITTVEHENGHYIDEHMSNNATIRPKMVSHDLQREAIHSILTYCYNLLPNRNGAEGRLKEAVRLRIAEYMKISELATKPQTLKVDAERYNPLSTYTSNMRDVLDDITPVISDDQRRLAEQYQKEAFAKGRVVTNDYKTSIYGMMAGVIQGTKYNNKTDYHPNLITDELQQRICSEMTYTVSKVLKGLIQEYCDNFYQTCIPNGRLKYNALNTMQRARNSLFNIQNKMATEVEAINRNRSHMHNSSAEIIVASASTILGIFAAATTAYFVNKCCTKRVAEIQEEELITMTSAQEEIAAAVEGCSAIGQELIDVEARIGELETWEQKNSKAIKSMQNPSKDKPAKNRGISDQQKLKLALAERDRIATQKDELQKRHNELTEQLTVRSNTITSSGVAIENIIVRSQSLKEVNDSIVQWREEVKLLQDKLRDEANRYPTFKSEMKRVISHIENDITLVQEEINKLNNKKGSTPEEYLSNLQTIYSEKCSMLHKKTMEIFEKVKREPKLLLKNRKDVSEVLKANSIEQLNAIEANLFKPKQLTSQTIGQRKL